MISRSGKAAQDGCPPFRFRERFWVAWVEKRSPAGSGRWPPRRRNPLSRKNEECCVRLKRFRLQLHYVSREPRRTQGPCQAPSLYLCVPSVFSFLGGVFAAERWSRRLFYLPQQLPAHPAYPAPSAPVRTARAGRKPSWPLPSNHAIQDGIDIHARWERAQALPVLSRQSGGDEGFRERRRTVPHQQ
jgi:hypothetical protein